MSRPAEETESTLPTTWSDAEWQKLSGQPASIARNTRLADRLGVLARTDPARALGIAQAEDNPLLKENLIQAVLRGWAETRAADALQWADALDDPLQRSAAVETVFASAAAVAPALAVELAEGLFLRDAGSATGYGCTLVDALCAAGHFETAVELSTASKSLTSTARSILLTKAYFAWASMQPEQAARAAAGMTNPSARVEALNAVAGGWGVVNPAALTRFVSELPPGPERIPLMGQALRAWAGHDAPAAAQWVRANDVGPGLDDGVAAMAGAGFMEPKVAASWASEISSPVLRSQTLLTVLRNWANADPDSARSYFERTADLQPADRVQAAALFAPPGGL